MALRLSGKQLLDVMEPKTLVSRLEHAFIDYMGGAVKNPLRVSITSGADWWGVMPAFSPKVGFCVKAVSVLPGNKARGLPTTRAVTLLFDAVDGAPLAVLDGTTLTGIRTAAVSALLLQHTDQPEDLFFLGAGLQARFHARILSSLFDIKSVNALSRTEHSRRQFLEECGHLGVTVNPRLKLEDADTVVVATTSASPVLNRLSHKNRVVLSIGAPTPDSRELGDQVLQDASVVVVDTAEGCLKEAGDIVQTLESGVLESSKIIELGTLIASRTTVVGRVVYKSVGSAFMDLYSSAYFYERASKLGVGDTLEI